MITTYLDKVSLDMVVPFAQVLGNGLPPYFGAGLVQVRASTVIPVPQDTLHGVKTNQLDQPPFTMQ